MRTKPTCPVEVSRETPTRPAASSSQLGDQLVAAWRSGRHAGRGGRADMGTTARPALSMARLMRSFERPHVGLFPELWCRVAVISAREAAPYAWVPAGVKAGRRFAGASTPSGGRLVVGSEALGATRTRVVRVTGVTSTYVGDHGDPYVFPAGSRSRTRRPARAASTGAPAGPRRRRLQEEAVPAEASQEARYARGGAPRRARCAPGAGRSPASSTSIFRGVAAVWLAVAHGIGGLSAASGAAPVTSTPSTVATASAC